MDESWIRVWVTLTDGTILKSLKTNMFKCSLLIKLFVEKGKNCLTASEFAEIFNITRHTVAKWIREGKSMTSILPGGRYRILESEVEKL
ncbi:MAG: helix-turn-helix domain-containing protein [Thermoproteota archaeon]